MAWLLSDIQDNRAPFSEQVYWLPHLSSAIQLDNP